jgi:hypothetical protein
MGKNMGRFWKTFANPHECSLPGGTGEYHDLWVHTAQGWRIVHHSMVVALEFGNSAALCPADS